MVGTGKERDLKDRDQVKLGGVAMGKIPKSASQATIMAELGSGAMKGDQIANLVLGARLRAYRFDRYKTKRKEDDERATKVEVNFACANPAAAEKSWAAAAQGLADGVVWARDLVNEPANVLYPGGIRAPDAPVSESSASSSRFSTCQPCASSEWARSLASRRARRMSRNLSSCAGAAASAAPTRSRLSARAYCFDSGGISIKPAAGMEDMKGDMAGAACVTGLMHALAARKAKVNVVGAIGLVENMPDGKAQRPGDIVTSMSGQTIEIINTDAEGRLVLADLLHYVNKRFKPRFMVNLATLTGAIIVALGQEYAGLFSNDDKLSERLTKAGEATGERVWRMPLGPEYDKIIDSKFADVKNSAGPQRRLHHGGAISAALRRQDTLGASRHRRHRAWLAADRYQQKLEFGLGSAPARPSCRGPLRALSAPPAVRAAAKRRRPLGPACRNSPR